MTKKRLNHIKNLHNSIAATKRDEDFLQSLHDLSVKDLEDVISVGCSSLKDVRSTPLAKRWYKIQQAKRKRLQRKIESKVKNK